MDADIDGFQSQQTLTIQCESLLLYGKCMHMEITIDREAIGT